MYYIKKVQIINLISDKSISDVTQWRTLPRDRPSLCVPLHMKNIRIGGTRYKVFCIFLRHHLTQQTNLSVQLNTFMSRMDVRLQFPPLSPHTEVRRSRHYECLVQPDEMGIAAQILYIFVSFSALLFRPYSYMDREGGQRTFLLVRCECR